MQPLYLTSLGIAIAALGLTGCQMPPGRSQTELRRVLLEAEAPARAAGLSNDELAAAQRLCVNKCARCHKFYDPADYASRDWQVWMFKMSAKARLKPDQQEILSRFLEAYRQGKRG